MPIIGVEAIGNYCEILAFDKAVASQCIEKCNGGRRLTGGGNQEAEAINTARLLRLRRKRPRRRAADERNELAPPHSITSSAATRTVCGTLMPSVLAALRLRTNW